MVEHLDGHTDIIHKQLYSDWLPWSVSILSNIYDLYNRQLVKSLSMSDSIVISHDMQGNETERFIIATLLEKGR